MSYLKRWISGLIVASVCAGTTVGTSTDELSFAKRLDALQTGSNSVSLALKGSLTREEAAVLIVEELGYKEIAKLYASQNSFGDVNTHKGEINLVKSLGIMNGTSQTTFNPKGYVSVESANSIISRIKTQLSAPFKWKHACYAISSSSQMDHIKYYNAISFGWAHIELANGNFSVNTTTGDFKVPAGFEIAVDTAKNNGVETYLMVYFDDYSSASSLLNSQAKRTKLISEMVHLCKGISKDGQTRSFDGLTIDFEQLYSEALQAPYVAFLKELKAALVAQGKKLNVAVQPTTYFKGYDYKGIGEAADHVILMAHDYGAKSLTASEAASGIVNTPLTPIKEVYLTLKQAANSISKEKLALQISYASVQWQMRNNVVLNTTAYTPTYSQVAERLNTTGTTIHFDPSSQDSYATYEADGIKNVIWYESSRSVEVKQDLAKLLGISGISYWRLGNMPN